MNIFEYMEQHGHEQLVLCQDKGTGLKGIIAIHSTVIGPALGGLRMWNYESEEAAILDALRLSRGMTYKNAVAGLEMGGGKSVIIGDSRSWTDREGLFRSFGRYVQSLNGRYITAEDVGTSTADIEYVRTETDFAAGIAVESGGSGDPSPFTALGVFQGILACAQETWGSTDITGKVIAVQGLGHVGYYLCKHLHEAGAKLIVTDLYADSCKRVVDEFGAEYVKPEDIYAVQCDIFSPNALGAIINDETIPVLKAKIVAGAANNQLKENAHGDRLMQLGILYAPDYVINAGGVINVADELEPSGYSVERSTAKVMKVFQNVLDVLAIAKNEGIPTYVAADRLAEKRIAQIGKLKRTYLG